MAWPGWMASPVLVWEMTAAARSRWFYLGRVVLVGVMWAGIAILWGETVSRLEVVSHRVLAGLGESIVMAIVGIQLVLVLFAAPGVMVTSIGMDRLRGLLSHVLVTDLSSREIVWGKLLGRLGPLVLVLACSLPVTAMITLLGGVDPVFLSCAYFVIFATMAFTGALGLACSLWCGKIHEAIILCFVLIAVWFLLWPVGEWLRMDLRWLLPVRILDARWSGGTAAWSVVYGCSLLVLALALILLVTWRLRPVCAGDSGRQRSWGWGRTRVLREWLRDRLRLTAFAPDLDRNPVLWRECRRRRATAAGMWVLGAYLLIAGGFSVISITGARGSDASGFAAFVNGFQCSFALLLMVVFAASALGEERARGSLDILMTTPLSTSTILWGKWLGIMRWSVPLAVFPMMVLAGRLFKNPNLYSLMVFVLALVLFFAYCAAISSCCLLLATRIVRQTRVMGIALAGYVLVTVGWIFAAMALDGRNESSTVLSPFMAFGGLTYETGQISESLGFGNRYWYGCLIVLGFLIVVTLVSMLITWGIFEACLGRMPESGRGRRGSVMAGNSVKDKETGVSL